MALINRNPFSRTETHRATVKVWNGETCAWCGNRKSSKTGGAYLYCYSTENDSGRRNVHRGLFCSKSCHDSYHS